MIAGPTTRHGPPLGLEVFCHAALQESDWVIRAAQLQRNVYDEAGECRSLRVLLDRRPVAGVYELHVPQSKNQPKSQMRRGVRVARMEVRYAQVTIKRPKRATPYLRAIEFEELAQWAVEAREVGAPPGIKPLHWVLWTSLPVHSLEDALVVVQHYEKRWLIEEFHKAIKTGCDLESRQYETAARLEAVAGITCVLAIRLLQLKTIARVQPELPADRIVPKVWLSMLSALRKRPLPTVRDFFRISQ